MAYIPLHHKYRPQTFADLVGQEAIATTLTNALRLQKIAPAYLFTGPRGTGKTSSARILAKSLNCIVSPVPTAQPCGKCDVCRAIALGAALDIIEIDAASNTGVDNIREIIERAQYAPVQCRYKVYIIDECLTGESLVLTSNGWTRIDDRTLVNQKVLSYDEHKSIWEWKKVLRWLDRGEKLTLTIKTTEREISCTGNHLIRTDHGWMKAQELKPGMKILSPLSPLGSKQKNVVFTAISDSMLAPVVNGWQTYDLIQSHQWHTSLEMVESVNLAGVENVYDLEVEDNHNFVANGLLVHNCHMLTTAAFNSLLKTLEEPPDRVVFVLATTDPQRVLPTIISRCQRFDYRRIPVDAMVKHLTYIAGIEQIEIAAASVKLVAQIAQGGLRDAESLLDRLSLLDGEITPDRVYDAIGSVPEQDLLEILQAISKSDPESLLDLVRNILERGKEPLIVLQNLAGCYRDLLIAKTAPKRPDLVALTAETWLELGKIAQTWQVSWILAGQKHLKDSEVQLKHTTQPQLWLEIAILGLLSVSIQPASAPLPVGVPSSSRSTPQPSTPPEIIQHQSSIATPPPAAQLAPPVQINTLDLASTWEQVLQQLLPASRDLFKPFGKLIAVSEEQAVVAMKSSTMQTIASGKVPELAKVFSQMFNRSIAVKLEVMGKSQVQPSSTAPAPTAIPAPLKSIPQSGGYANEPPPNHPSLSSTDTSISAPPAREDLSSTKDLEDRGENNTQSSLQPIAELLPAISLSPPQSISLLPTPPAEIDPFELDPPTDFAEPPDSVDLARAENTKVFEPEEPEIEPLLQVATDHVVKLFNGEIIDQTHQLFDQIVGT